MEKTIKPFLRSSVDPNKISLTIESGAKFVIFFVGYFALAKGLDPATATTQIQAITDVVLSLVPACFAVYHGLQTVWGLVRKFTIN